MIAKSMPWIIVGTSSDRPFAWFSFACFCCMSEYIPDWHTHKLNLRWWKTPQIDQANSNFWGIAFSHNLELLLQLYLQCYMLCKCVSEIIIFFFLKSVVYMYAHKRNLILMFLHICRNCETALINCLIVLIIFVCGIVVFICVCSITRTGC